MSISIGVIGCGNMGSAIVRSASDRSSFTFAVYDSDSEAASRLAQHTGALFTESIEQLIAESQIILLAVKPQILPSLYPGLRACAEGKSFISIAAGIRLSDLSKGLGTVNVVRAMPNIAASVSMAVTAVTAADECDSSLIELSKELFECCGSVIALDERQFSAFIGISGSAIAYMFQFLHATALGGTLCGIPYQSALSIVKDTYRGAISLLESEGCDPVSLLTRVTSAG